MTFPNNPTMGLRHNRVGSGSVILLMSTIDLLAAKLRAFKKDAMGQYATCRSTG
jgi:hypothetical protein